MNVLRKHVEEHTLATEMLPRVVDYTKLKIVLRCQKLTKQYELSQRDQKLDVHHFIGVDTRPIGYQRLEA